MRISLAHNGPDCLLKNDFCREYKDRVVELDLSFNDIVDLMALRDFSKLKRLIICHNDEVNSTTCFPRLVSLETLWVNYCHIDNLTLFVERVAAAFPNLRYLSMFGNNACRNIFNGGSLGEYNDYRKFVVSKLPNLIYLEDKAITTMEREKARLKYGGVIEKVGLGKVLGKQKKSRSKKMASRKSDVRQAEPEHPYARRNELVIPGQSENPDDEWTTDEEDIDYWAGYKPFTNTTAEA
jgi:hypothetical protein